MTTACQQIVYIWWHAQCVCSWSPAHIKLDCIHTVAVFLCCSAEPLKMAGKEMCVCEWMVISFFLFYTRHVFIVWTYRVHIIAGTFKLLTFNLSCLHILLLPYIFSSPLFCPFLSLFPLTPSFLLPPCPFIYPGTVCISMEPWQVFVHSSDTVL